MIVPDASVVVAAVADDQNEGNVARAVILQDQLVAPHLMLLEVTSALRRWVFQGRISDARAAEAVMDLNALPVDYVGHGELLARIWELRANVTPYDASYVALAEALSAVLVTTDRRLARAPGIGCQVEVIG